MELQVKVPTFQDREIQRRASDSPVSRIRHSDGNLQVPDSLGNMPRKTPLSHHLSLKWAPPKRAVDTPGWDGDIPSEDVEETTLETDPLMLQVAPDTSDLHIPTGYENTTHGRPSIVPPPSGDHDADHHEDHEYEEVPGISENEARNLLLDYVSEHFCYGTRAASDMHITTIQETHSLYYKLETFAEGRTTSWTHEVYNGQSVEGPKQGSTPPPWEVHVSPDEMFCGQVKRVEVPYTAHIKSCYACKSLGYNRCYKCYGRGKVRCKFCGGSVHVQHKDIFTRQFCSGCSGTGRVRCKVCHGDGRIVCRVCDGYRQLKWYIELKVQFTNHVGEHFVGCSAIPHDIMRVARGHTALEQCGKKVWPIKAYPNEDICKNSKRLYHLQRAVTMNERTLQQRHKLEVVPVAEILYAWNGKIHKFFIYGNDHKIYVQEYPQKYCWGCQIL
ncbi:protein SSUH2 homolog [Glandiceps talaboti]